MEYKVTIEPRINRDAGYTWMLHDSNNMYKDHGRTTTIRGAKRQVKKAIKKLERDFQPIIYTVSTSKEDKKPVFVEVEMWVGESYCVTCRMSVPFRGEVKTSDSGRRRAVGKCDGCNNKIYRILGRI